MGTFTIFHITGFEVEANTTQTEMRWRGNTTAANCLLGSGHSLTPALDVGTALSLPSGAGIISRASAAGNGSSVVTAGSYWCEAIWRSSNASGRRILTLYTPGTGINLYLVWNTDDTFELFDRTGTSKGKSNGTYAVNTRHYVELAVGTPASNSRIDLFVNGALDKTYTNIDIRAGGTVTSFAEWHFCSDGTNATTGDDVVIDDVMCARETNTFAIRNFGNLKVEALVGTADGSSLQLTPSSGSTHYTLVDDIPPSTSDYLSNSGAGTGGGQDLFTIPKPSSSDTSTKRVYGLEFVGYLRGGTQSGGGANGRFGGKSTGSNPIAVSYGGNGQLDPNQDWLYYAPLAIPNSASSDQSASSAGAIIDNHWSGGGGIEMGPFANRTTTTVQALKVYSFAVEIIKDYYAQTAGFRIGTLAWN